MPKNTKNNLNWVDNVDETGRIFCTAEGDNGVRYVLQLSSGGINFNKSTVLGNKLSRLTANFFAIKEYDDLDYSRQMAAKGFSLEQFTFKAARELCERDYAKYRNKNVIEWLAVGGFRNREDFPEGSQAVGICRATANRYFIKRTHPGEENQGKFLAALDYRAVKLPTDEQGQPILKNKKAPSKSKPLKSFAECVEWCERDNEKKLDKNNARAN